MLSVSELKKYHRRREGKGEKDGEKRKRRNDKKKKNEGWVGGWLGGVHFDECNQIGPHSHGSQHIS